MPRPRSDIRPRIIEAARERFLVDGVDGASLRRIARRAHTSIGMIYYYFPSKDDLFLGVVEDVYAGLLADLSVALGAAEPIDDRVRRLCARLGRMSDVELTVIRLVVREALGTSTRRARLLERFATGHLPLIVGTVLEGQRQGVFTDRFPLPLLVVVLGTIAFVPQVARRLVDPTSPIPLASLPSGEAIAPDLAAIVLRAIGRNDEPA